MELLEVFEILSRTILGCKYLFLTYHVTVLYDSTKQRFHLKKKKSYLHNLLLLALENGSILLWRKILKLPGVVYLCHSVSAQLLNVFSFISPLGVHSEDLKNTIWISFLLESVCLSCSTTLKELLFLESLPCRCVVLPFYFL